MYRTKTKILSIVFIIALAVAVASCGVSSGNNSKTGVSSFGENSSLSLVSENSGSTSVSNSGSSSSDSSLSSSEQQQPFPEDILNVFNSIPAYSGSASVKVNDDRPFFDRTSLSLEPFENYSKRDAFGRCGAAYANVCKELMPTEPRGVVGAIKPTGWHTVKYAGIDGNYLYNRCHLIGYQLTGENANEDNLITGTRYMNVDGMQPFENRVADYVERTGHHMHYRVTPYFVGEELLSRGVLVEAQSVEDDEISFCRFCYNVQPGVEINYADGSSTGPEYTGNNDNKASEPEQTKDNAAIIPVPSDNAAQTYVLNTNTKKFHFPTCDSVNDMAEKNKKVVTKPRDEIISDGYVPCKRCKP